MSRRVILGLAIVLSFNNLSAQEMRKLELDGVVYSYPIYTTTDSYTEYTKHIIVQFKNNSIIELEPERIYSREHFRSMKHGRSEKVNDFMDFMSDRYGVDEIRRYYKYGTFGDTLRVNIRTGQQVVVSDDTQVLLFTLQNYIPLDTLSVIARTFREFVRHIEGPEVGYLMISPNDPEVSNQWPIPYMDFQKAWELVNHSNNINIAISDNFRTSGSLRHEDLQLISNGGNVIEYASQKVFLSSSSTYDGDFDHGNLVASVASATFNNSKGIAGYSNNARILPFAMLSPGIQAAITYGADIINCSWISGIYASSASSSHYSSALATKVKDALNMGIVVIASAGNSTASNNPPIQPVVVYPAAFDFGVDGRVIAVTSSQLIPNPTNPSYERRPHAYNYSPGTNPFIDPLNSFIDIAAPGSYIPVIKFNDAHDYDLESGTSMAAPIVSSVAALVLSINPSITPSQMYDILTLSTDDIILEYEADNPVNYVTHPDGIRQWNRFSGYGRLNAYKAVKAALPAQYSSHSFSGNLTLDSAHIFGTGSLSSSVTLTIPSGKVAVVDGTLNGSSGATLRVYGKLILDEGTTLNNVEIVVESGGELVARGETSNKITLNNKGIIFKSGSVGEINDCVINNATRGIDITSSNPNISNCSFTNNSTGIYLAGGSTSQTQITGNTFSGSNYSIASYYSSPTITGNTISDSQYGYYGVVSPAVISNNVFGDNIYGFYLTGSSIPSAQHNIFSDHIYGIYAESPSTATVEYNNVFLTTSWDYGVRADASAIVNVPYNYWGSYPPGSGYFYATGGASITYTPAAPSAFSLKTLPQGLALAISESEEKSAQLCAEPLLNGFRQEEDLGRQHSWLSGVAGCYLVANDYRGFVDFLAREVNVDVSDHMHGITLDLEAPFLVQDGNYEEAISNYTEITQRFSENSLLHQNALFGLGYIHTALMNDPETGGTYFNELSNTYPESGLSLAISRLRTQDDSDGDPRNQEMAPGQDVWRVSAYPNPFNPTTVIGYQLPQAEMVHLAVYDILGREVALLVDKYVAAGTHRINFDGSGLSSGIYLYRLQAGNQVLTGKMMLMK